MGEYRKIAVICLVISLCAVSSSGDEKPFITTQTPLTLLSANDAETDPGWRRTKEGLIDRNVKTKDSFTVIRLGPDHPPICRTIYGTVPCTMLGTPTMAMSADGRYGLIANHNFRPVGWVPLKYPPGTPMTNEDITPADLRRQQCAPPHSNMVSMIDLGSPKFKVVDRILFDDQPMHVLRHPDGKHFVVGGSRHFYVFKIKKGRLTRVSRSTHEHGNCCFWINPAGDRIIATHGDTRRPATVHWYSYAHRKIHHLSEVKVLPDVDTELLAISAIVRMSADGKRALICQRAGGGAGNLCDVLVADLSLNPPAINAAIKQVGDGVESFAFHPNGKMGVVTCLGLSNNAIAVLNMTTHPPQVLSYLDTGGGAQGIEFTPEGDKLFVGSPVTNRIEVYDVVGDFGLRKSQMFLKTGHGHCSLTLGPTFKK